MIKMIGYLMIGTNDLKKSARFYEELFKDMGVIRAYETEELVSWNFGEGTTLFTITKPYNNNPATVGNGIMVALKVEKTTEVDRLHDKALKQGGVSEGDPGPRGKGFYAAYFRDLDGNKLNFFCYT